MIFTTADNVEGHEPPDSPRVLEVSIKGDSIKLGQFLKLASLVGTGGEAKELIGAGVVTVNGEPVTARGHNLVVGDEVRVLDQCARVTSEDDDVADEPWKDW